MEKKDDRVELLIPKGSANEEPNLLIGFNGKNYLLPRGRRSFVPAAVAAEYHRSVAAQETLDARMDSMQEKGK